MAKSTQAIEQTGMLPRSAGLRVSGKVVLIDAAQGVLMVRRSRWLALGARSARTFLITSQTQIVLVDGGQRIELDDVVPGDQVEVVYVVYYGEDVARSITIYKKADDTQAPGMEEARQRAIDELSAGLVETMTVNHVLSRHPKTREVFDNLAVSSAYEGCDSLEEVAWRRGMDGRELLGHLGAVLGHLERAIHGGANAVG